MRSLLATAALAIVLVLAACGDDDDAEPDSAPAEQAAEELGGEADTNPAEREKHPAAEKPGTEIKVGQSQFGEILFDGDDQAIYLFDKETSAKSECYGGCAEAWPPVLTKGEPVGAGGAKGSLLGTTKRDDGSVQVTYDGQPLYYYAHEGPGEVLCHGVNEFGGLWLVLGADGQAL